jgi:hypothetical protein
MDGVSFVEVAAREEDGRKGRDRDATMVGMADLRVSLLGLLLISGIDDADRNV